jgi:predicted RecB family nuclease
MDQLQDRARAATDEAARGRMGYNINVSARDQIAGADMRKPITPESVVAYTQCPRKAFLLLCTDEQGKPHEYPTVLAQQQRMSLTEYLERFKREHPEAIPFDAKLPGGSPVPVLDATIGVEDLEAHCAVLTPAARAASATDRGYEPAIVVGTRTISKEQRLGLIFAGYVIGQLQRAMPATGSVVNMDGVVRRIPLAAHYSLLDPIMATLRNWMHASPDDPPPAILNKHCPQCSFRTACIAEAERRDDLSLLDRITPKARQRYHARGVFTVRQLSYLFRPRRRRKRAHAAPVQHQPELQALALREGKTYLHEPPTLIRQAVELFLDMEGIPDRNLYYLIGILVCNDGTATYHSYWADTPEDEEGIWHQFLALIDEYPAAPIYHYGHYESRALTTLGKRYHTDCPGLLQRLVNVNGFIYGKVYFPIHSNRLKDIGSFLGYSWTEPEASGLQSVIWHYRWEATRDNTEKQRLLTYNEDDCKALRALADELTRLRDSAESQPSVDLSSRPKRHATATGDELHRQFGAILRSAHASYEHVKISLEQARKPRTEERRPGGQPGHSGHRRIVPKANKIIRVPPRPGCPRCDGEPLQRIERFAEKTILDLVFTSAGFRKTVTKYTGPYGYCRQCGRSYQPPDLTVLGSRAFGRGLQALVVYQRLVLRLPYRTIVQAMDEQFGIHISEGAVANCLRVSASDYAETETRCWQRLLLSPFIHVDETKVSIQGVDQYVWVFTDGRHVMFRLTATREATVVQDLLAGYDGVLVTDFYAGYDAMPCRQQKCLVHLIRDLNEDLWHAPFDTELESFILEVRDLIVPILEACGRYGLKKRHLSKFLGVIDRFYSQAITGKVYRSEIVQTYQKRFRRYRRRLFTFLEEDDIPWNNNMAERAIRHVAVQRKISGSFFASVAPQYLLLLGVAQTCRFQRKSLLQFLLSGGKDIDAFKASKRAKSPVLLVGSSDGGRGRV